MAQVSVLRMEDEARVDPDRLETLFHQLGSRGAEDVVCRAMEELAVRLADLEARYREASWADVSRLARSLIAIADQLGMIGLARAAADVSVCAKRQDVPALGATVARLGRIADRSLTAVWDAQDVPG